MLININPQETQRFGVVCAQIDGLADVFPDLAIVNRQAVENHVEMISTRVDVSHLDRVHRLEADGFKLMDTLVIYGGALDQLDAPVNDLDGVSFVRASPMDAGQVAQVAKAAFANYIGHYHSDPRLDSSSADAVYVDWAQSCVQDHSTSGFVVLATGSTREIFGFLSTQKNSSEEFEIVLNAIHPDHQGKGIYKNILCHTVAEVKQLGAKRLTTSTQINNYKVQKVWAGIGMSHQKSLYTFHKWFS